MAEIAKPSRWGSILSGIQNTEPSAPVVTHPRATLDAQAGKIRRVRKDVLELDIEIRKANTEYDRTLTDIEKHYTQQLESIREQYRERMTALRARYLEAHETLMREQAGFAEMAKSIDAKVEFVRQFPEPEEDDGEQSRP